MSRSTGRAGRDGECRDQARVFERDELGDGGALRHADEVDRADVEMLDQRRRVGDQIAQAVARLADRISH